MPSKRLYIVDSVVGGEKQETAYEVQALVVADVGSGLVVERFAVKILRAVRGMRPSS